MTAFLVCAGIILILVGFIIKGISLAWACSAFPMILHTMILPNTWYVILGCVVIAALFVAGAIISYYPYSNLYSIIGAGAIGGIGTALICVIGILQKLFIGSSDSWPAVLIMTILVIPLVAIIAAITVPPVIELCGFIISLLVCIIKRKTTCIGFLASAIGHIGVSLMSLILYLALGHDHSIEIMLHNYAKTTVYGSQYLGLPSQLLIQFMHSDTAYTVVISLVMIIVGFGVSEFVSKQQGSTGLIILMFETIFKTSSHTDGSSSSITKGTSSSEPMNNLHVMTTPTMEHKEVRRPDEFVRRGNEVVEIDSNTIRKPSRAFCKGDAVYELDGKYIRMPSGAYNQGDIVYELDGKYIRKPSGAYNQGDIVYVIDDDCIIRKPSGIFS